MPVKLIDYWSWPALAALGLLQAVQVVAFHPDAVDVFQAIKNEVFPDVLPFFEDKRVLFRDGLNHTTLLPRDGLDDVLASPIVPFDAVGEGDRLEVVVNGSDVRKSTSWEPCVVQALNPQTGVLDLELIAPSARAGLHVRQSWGLARFFPWRFATVQQNDTVLVGTESGWKPAQILAKTLENDTVDLVFPDGAKLQSARPRIKLQDRATQFDQGAAYGDLAEGERIKVETSRGWEIATVIKKHEQHKSLDIEMFPDGERFLDCKPLVRKPKTAANEAALALWADNQRLRKRLAVLSSLKAVFASTAMAKVAWYVARHHIDDYVQEYRKHGLPDEAELNEDLHRWGLSV